MSWCGACVHFDICDEPDESKESIIFCGDYERKINMQALLKLIEKLESDVIVVPSIAGSYHSGYIAAYHDIARELRKVLEDKE